MIPNAVEHLPAGAVGQADVEQDNIRLHFVEAGTARLP